MVASHVHSGFPASLGHTQLGRSIQVENGEAVELSLESAGNFLDPAERQQLSSNRPLNHRLRRASRVTRKREVGSDSVRSFFSVMSKFPVSRGIRFKNSGEYSLPTQSLRWNAWLDCHGDLLDRRQHHGCLVTCWLNTSYSMRSASTTV